MDEITPLLNSNGHLVAEIKGIEQIGEQLPYSNYATTDWMKDEVKQFGRYRQSHSHRGGLRWEVWRWFDATTGWIAAAIIGALTACIAYLVDMAVPVVSDWKEGYCHSNILLSRSECCRTREDPRETCSAFQEWSTDQVARYAIYVAFAVLFGAISSSLTMLTKQSLPSGRSRSQQLQDGEDHSADEKTIYTAAGSGIPEIKTVLSGFVIPNLLTPKVLVVKAVGAIFAVATGMCLGKEGPFVHISTCVGWIVARRFPKYRENGLAMRHMLSVACAAGLGVAFGAPVGGVLFSYEEISTYFPRRVLWRSFLCSLAAAIVLKQLNPTGTGKLILFETSFANHYAPIHYLVFAVLGIAGGVFGGVFCKLNLMWSRFFRGISVVKSHPVFEVALISAVTALLQFPNPLIRSVGDVVIKDLLVDCAHQDMAQSWVCLHESSPGLRLEYIIFLVYGTLAKLFLTIITFGIKVPSGVIIPALGAGALFGRLVGFLLNTPSPGIDAMVGAAAFLAGVSRMTISLCVIMLELTGGLDYVVPHMVAILVAKWVADSISREGVYDVAQTVLSHPFLDRAHALDLIQRQRLALTANVLIPPRHTMDAITVEVPPRGTVSRHVLQTKLTQLHARGLMDAGIVLVTEQTGQLIGYLPQDELEFAMRNVESGSPIEEDQVRVHGTALTDAGESSDFVRFVDRVPFTMSENAPLEYLVELFTSLGLRYLVLTQDQSGRVVGVVLKKRLIAYIESLA